MRPKSPGASLPLPVRSIQALVPIVTMRIFDEPVVMVADRAGVGRWTTTISAVNGPWAVRPAVLTR